MASCAESDQLRAGIPRIMIDVMGVDLLFESVASLADPFSSLSDPAFLAKIVSLFKTCLTMLFEFGMIKLFINGHSFLSFGIGDERLDYSM